MFFFDFLFFFYQFLCSDAIPNIPNLEELESPVIVSLLQLILLRAYVGLKFANKVRDNRFEVPRGFI